MNIDERMANVIVRTPEVKLCSGEVCVYQAKCEYGEQVEKVTTTSKPGFGIGVGIPLTEHFGIGIGRRKVKTTTKRELVWDKTKSTILLTNERFIFKIGNNVQQIDFESINDIKLNKDAITIVSNGKPYSFFMSNNEVSKFMSVWQLLGEAGKAGYDFASASSTPQKKSSTKTAKASKPSPMSFEDCLNNNLKGKELEKAGEIDKAIELYESNLAAGFKGTHPYTRLAIIYRKRKDYENEIRVLNAAIEMFGTESHNYNGDSVPSDYYTRLQKAKELQKKQLEK